MTQKAPMKSIAQPFSRQYNIKHDDFICSEHIIEQVAFQSNANHPLAESMGYIKFEGMYILL